MKIRSLLVATLSFFLLLYGAVFSQTRPEIIFVSSEEELQSALNNPDAFKALAISGDFYRKSSLQTQQSLEALARYVLDSNSLRPVFLYGHNLNVSDLDPPMLQRIFGDWEPKTNCVPLALVGIFPTIRIADLSGATVHMCGSVEGLHTEKWFRQWILGLWLKEKADLADSGYATIP